MMNIKNMRKQYESIKTQNQMTPKKYISLTPTISAQKIKEPISPIQKQFRQKKQICTNCINQKIIINKQNKQKQEKMEDLQLREQIERNMNQENQLYNTQQLDLKNKYKEYKRVNGEILDINKQKSLSEHKVQQQERTHLKSQIQKDAELQNQLKSQKKIEHNHYLKDLQNQISFKEQNERQLLQQNLQSDQMEQKYWSSYAEDKEHEQIKRKQQQRQLANYWKTNQKDPAEQKKEFQQQEQEQLKLIKKMDDQFNKIQINQKLQQQRQLKETIEEQIKTNALKKQKEIEQKQQEYQLLQLKASYEEQQEKLKNCDRIQERQNYLSEIDNQIKFKERMKQEQNDIFIEIKSPLIQDPIPIFDKCDECLHTCNQKQLSRIIE